MTFDLKIIHTNSYYSRFFSLLIFSSSNKMIKARKSSRLLFIQLLCPSCLWLAAARPSPRCFWLATRSAWLRTAVTVAKRTRSIWRADYLPLRAAPSQLRAPFSQWLKPIWLCQVKIKGKVMDDRERNHSESLQPHQGVASSLLLRRHGGAWAQMLVAEATGCSATTAGLLDRCIRQKDYESDVSHTNNRPSFYRRCVSSPHSCSHCGEDGIL